MAACSCPTRSALSQLLATDALLAMPLKDSLEVVVLLLGQLTGREGDCTVPTAGLEYRAYRTGEAIPSVAAAEEEDE